MNLLNINPNMYQNININPNIGKPAIPDTLTIFLDTNVEGSPFLIYKPNMTNPSNKDNKVYIDSYTLYKKISKENIKNKPIPFIDKGLFESFLRESKQGTEKKDISIKDAIASGYITNNVDITLKSLFNIGSKIYIGNKSYIINEATYKPKEWKIDVKLPELSKNITNNTFNTALHNTIVLNNINNGKKELADFINETGITLNSNNLYKSNEIQPIIENLSIAPAVFPTVITTDNTNNPAPVYSAITNGPYSITQGAPIATVPAISPTLIQATTPFPQLQITNAPINNSIPINLYPLPGPGQPVSQNIVNILDSITSNKDTILTNKPNVANILKTIEAKVSTSKSKPETLIKIFFNNLYTNVINTLYKYSDSNIQNALKIFLNNTTNVNVKQDKTINLSQKAFNENINSLRIVKNAGGGDCLFLSIAKALNDYNAFNTERINITIDNKQYGSINGEPFNNNNLRLIVWEYINKHPDMQLNMLNDARIIYDRLMKLYNNESLNIKGLESESQWRVRIQRELEIENADRYSLIDKNPTFDIKNPFILQADEKTLQNFILSSNYWGDEYALHAIKESLGLVVFPIILDNNNIPGIVNINISNLGNNWSHYVFLYLTINGGGHWELIEFNYGTKIGNVSIFKKDVLPENENSYRYIPPIYLIVLMFLLLYIEIDYLEQKNVSFLNWAFESLKQSYELINNIELQNISDLNKRNELDNFFNYLDNTFCYEGNKSTLCENAQLYKAKSLSVKKPTKTRKAKKIDVDQSNIISNNTTRKKTIQDSNNNNIVIQDGGVRNPELDKIIEDIKKAQKKNNSDKIVLVSTRTFPGTNKNPIHSIIENGDSKDLGNNGFISANKRNAILNPNKPIYNINTNEINQENVDEILQFLQPKPVPKPDPKPSFTSRITSLFSSNKNTTLNNNSNPPVSPPPNPPVPPPPIPSIPSPPIPSDSQVPSPSLPSYLPPPPPQPIPSIPSPSEPSPSLPSYLPPPPPQPIPSEPPVQPLSNVSTSTLPSEEVSLIKELNKMIKKAKAVGKEDAFIPAAQFQVDNNLGPAIIGINKKNGDKLYLVNGKLNIDSVSNNSNYVKDLVSKPSINDTNISTNVEKTLVSIDKPASTTLNNNNNNNNNDNNNDIEIIPFVPNADPSITRVELEKIITNKNTLVLFNENIFQYIAFHSGVGNRDGIKSENIIFGENNDNKAVSFTSTVISKPKSNEEEITSLLRPLQVTNVRSAAIPVGPEFNNPLDTIYMPLITKSAVSSLLSVVTSGSVNENKNTTAIKPFMPEKATIKNILEDAFEYIKKLVISGCYTKIYYIANQATSKSSIIYNGLEYKYNSGNNMPISEEVESYIMENINKLTSFPVNSTYSSCYTASTIADNEFNKFVVKPGSDTTSSLLSNVKNESKLSYYMTVNLTLIPSDIKPEDRTNFNCKIKENKIKSTFSKVLGLQNPTLATLFTKKGGTRKISNKKTRKCK